VNQIYAKNCLKEMMNNNGMANKKVVAEKWQIKQ